MDHCVNQVWEQAVALDQCYGTDAVTVATTRMIDHLRARNYDAGGFWSDVANRLIEIQQIKTNIMPLRIPNDEGAFRNIPPAK